MWPEGLEFVAIFMVCHVCVFVSMLSGHRWHHSHCVVVAVFSLLFAQMVSAFYVVDPDETVRKARMLMIIFVCCGVGTGLCKLLQVGYD